MTTARRMGRVGLLVLGVVVLPGLVPAAAPGPAFLMKTHTYKKVGETNLQADVYRADDATVRPVVVWLHGGALIMGSRRSVPQDLRDLCRTDGFALVSFDYR